MTTINQATLEAIASTLPMDARFKAVPLTNESGLTGDYLVSVAEGFEDELADAIADAPARASATLKASLRAHLDAKWQQVSDGGTTLNIGTVQTPVLVYASTNANGKADILGLQMKGQMNMPLTWFQSTGPISITNEQLLTIGLAVAQHVEDALAVWTEVLADIESGAITTTAEIDAADWPQ